ncbi:MAG: REP-associated tyrosine transposase [Terriglobia bacterium]
MLKPRLHRLEWTYTSSPIYFITACTDRRRPLLAKDGVHRSFRVFAEEALNHRVWVGRYVLMPDHLHLFAGFADGSPKLSDWVSALKRTLSVALPYTRFPAPHWQKGFFDHALRSAESYGQKWAYVRDNPVRAGLVTVATDWAYQGEIFQIGML